MKLKVAAKLTSREAPWLHEKAHCSDIVFSTRVRLARNLKEIPFPSRASQEQRQQVYEKLTATCLSLHSLKPLLVTEMPELSDVDRKIFQERHLISRELSQKGKGSGVIVDNSQALSIMINEEDHLRLQSISAGLNLQAAWQRVDQLDNEVAHHEAIAFDETLGYLTACPTNVGTGMRASAMMHLPGLALTGMMPRIFRASGELGIAVRGLFGEGTEAIGHVFQFSNQTTLGESEPEILARLERILKQLVWSEQNARRKVLSQNKNKLFDVIGEAYGRLRYAYLLSSQEAVSRLCDLRLGACLGLLRHLTQRDLNELIVTALPGHLQLAAGCALSCSERAAFRAQVVRKKLTAAGTSP